METRAFQPPAFSRPFFRAQIFTRALQPQIASEPRRIAECRKRFLEEKFTSSQKAEAVVQGLLNALLLLPLEVGRVDAGVLLIFVTVFRFNCCRVPGRVREGVEAAVVREGGGGRVEMCRFVAAAVIVPWIH